MAAANGVRLPGSYHSVEPQLADGVQIPAPTSVRESLSIISKWPLSGSTVGLSVACVVCNFAYYGLIFALPQVLAADTDGAVVLGDPSAQMFMVTLFKAPGIVFAVLLIRAQGIGHRTTMAFLFGASAVVAWVYPVLASAGAHSASLLAAGMLKFFVSALFIVLYVFMLEVYPTRIRSTGMALCATAGRIGAVLSPQVYYFAIAHASVKFYFLTITVSSFAAAGMAMMIPQDTKGKPLAEDEETEASALLGHKK